MLNFIYCPQCRKKLDITKTYPYCQNCDETFYRNSKPCAGVLPIKNGKVLLSRRLGEPFKGEIDIIGGFLEEGELPEIGAIREVKEETCLNVKIIELLKICVDKYGEGGYYTLNIHYIGEIVSGKMKPQDDVLSLHWIPIMEVPTNEGFKNTQSTLKGLKKWFKQNHLKK